MTEFDSGLGLNELIEDDDDDDDDDDDNDDHNVYVYENDCCFSCDIEIIWKTTDKWVNIDSCILREHIVLIK